MNRVAFGSSKAGLDMLTKNMALELAPYDIRVNGIAPGGVPYDGNLEVTDGGVPLKRYGKGEDQAKAALYLASDDSEWVTGQIMVVDGGQSLK